MNNFFRIIFAAAIIAIPGAQCLAQEQGIKENTSPSATTDQEQSIVEDPEIQGIVDKYLPKLKAKDKKESEMALYRLQTDLMNIGNQKGKHPTEQTRRRLSQELIARYKKTKEIGIVQMIASYGDNEIAKPFIFHILESGTQQEKNQALGVLGLPGAITGNDVYDEIVKLTKTGVIDKDAKPAMLARINKDRALPEILKEVDSAQDKQSFLYAAWALQDYYHNPDYFKRILPRIKKFGLDKDKSFKGGNGLFWIDAGLFAAYVSRIKGADLQLALEYMSAHSEFIRPVSTPALIEKLSDNNPQIRTLAARALGREAEWSIEESENIQGPLRQAIQKETDPETKKSLQDVANGIERFQKEWNHAIEQRHKDSNR